MSKKLSRSDALEDISTWSTNDVLFILRKNGLEECCKAITKRQIDGDELLHLTEGKLALWKSDLTRPLIWSLWRFVEEIKRTPEKYVEEKHLETHGNEDHLSDTGSWGTDFEDEMNEESVDYPDMKKVIKNTPKFETNKKVHTKQEEELTYANCESTQEDEITYANFEDTKNLPPKNVSKLHSQLEKSLAEQLKEQLILRNVKKPTLGPKPETLPPRKIETIQADRNLPQKSFLYNVSKPKPIASSQAQKRMSVPPPPEPKKQKEIQTPIIEKSNRDISKPPITIRNFDLVANLPTRTEESEDEYESFDEQIIEQNQKKNMSRVGSKQSLASGHQSSVESVYRPPSNTSHEEQEEQYEIYESITETPDDNGYYLSPIQRAPSKEAPPPLPAKPPQSSTTPSPILSKTKPEKAKERSPDKKSATLPHVNSNNALATERATRPLPPPPDRQSYTDKPWFHNVSREQATALIKEQSSYGNPQDGYFLLRPSTSNACNPLALVLWYRDRVHKVPIRKRPDNRFAMGSVKVKEQSFTSIEEMVAFYSREELVLYFDRVRVGSTKLTDSPPK